MRIKELEDALEAEREARMRVRSITFFKIFVNCFLCLPTTCIIDRVPNHF